MMTFTTRAAGNSVAYNWLAVARHYLGGHRAIIVLVIVAVVVGAALNWSWLAAVGVAPVLLSALPCLVMCGLGLCMNRLVGRSCASASSQPPEVCRHQPRCRSSTKRPPILRRLPQACLSMCGARLERQLRRCASTSMWANLAVVNGAPCSRRIRVPHHSHHRLLSAPWLPSSSRKMRIVGLEVIRSCQTKCSRAVGRLGHK